MQRLSKQAKRQLNNDLPRAVAVLGTNHFKKSWETQGFEDRGISKWPSRKAPKATTKSGKPSKTYAKFQRKNGRPILYSHASDRQGTHLKDTIKGRTSGKRVIFSSDKVYAQVHNEGGRAGRGRGFKMRKRQFMGKSYALDRKIEKKIDRMVDNLIK